MADSGRKVLIADDEVDVHAFVAAALEADGYQVITACDGQDALDKIRAEMPDVVILDVQMPKKDGFTVFAELRGDEATKAIPVVMLTSVTARTGIKFGADAMADYIGSEPEAYHDKPINPDALRETVSKLMQA